MNLTNKSATSLVRFKAPMDRTLKWWLRRFIKISNAILLLLGVGTIVYTLWLQKEWMIGVSDFPADSTLPQPWFIYTCLLLGMAICFTTISVNAIPSYFRTTSMLSMCQSAFIFATFLLLETLAIVAVYYNLDPEKSIGSLFDSSHAMFKSFILYHINLCRLLSIFILTAQVTSVILGAIFWALLGDRKPRHSEAEQNAFSQSFLVPQIPEPATLI